MIHTQMLLTGHKVSENISTDLNYKRHQYVQLFKTESNSALLLKRDEPCFHNIWNLLACLAGLSSGRIFGSLKCVSLTLNVYDDKQAERVIGTTVLLLQENVWKWPAGPKHVGDWLKTI